MTKKGYLIGVDVGATKIGAALIKNNKIERRIKILTESQAGRKKVLKNIEIAIKEVWRKDVRAIGIAFAGEINQQKGIVVSSPNFPKTFKNVRVAKMIAKKFKKKVYLENDANCFTLAESMLGAGKGYKYVVGLTLGRSWLNLGVWHRFRNYY